MGLKIYKQVDDQYVAITSDNTSTIFTSHDGKRGDTHILQLFLRNDSSTLWFSNITITPEDTENASPDGDIIYTETGWGIKLSSASVEPTVAEWEDINWGDPIEMTDVGSDLEGDTTTYFPFWYLITCPPNTNAQNKFDIQLRVKYTENSVL